MRIIPYDDNTDIEEIESVFLLIKAVPFEGTYVPAYSLVAPSDDYFIKMDEIHCLMDGVEIAENKLDELISMMLQSRIGKLRDDAILYDQEEEEDDEDDIG